MELKPRLCLKCGTQIIGDKNDIRQNFIQHYMTLDNGNMVAVAFCTACKIEPSDYKDIQRALGLETEITGIGRSKNLKAIVMEKQGDICSICGQKITTKEIEVMPGMGVRHISCPMVVIPELIHPSFAGRTARDHNERNRRRRPILV